MSVSEYDSSYPLSDIPSSSPSLPSSSPMETQSDHNNHHSHQTLHEPKPMTPHSQVQFWDLFLSNLNTLLVLQDVLFFSNTSLFLFHFLSIFILYSKRGLSWLFSHRTILSPPSAWTFLLILSNMSATPLRMKMRTVRMAIWLIMRTEPWIMIHLCLQKFSRYLGLPLSHSCPNFFLSLSEN